MMNESELLEVFERVANSAPFVDAPRQQRFLRYLFTHLSDPNSAPLKGYTVGIDVFDRGPDFDPSVDSIVRVEAGRLRSKLTEYYAGEGRDEVTHFHLPKGRYCLEIQEHSVDTLAQELTELVVPANSIAVLPFVILSTDEQQTFMADGMTDAVINRLGRNQALRVTSFTSIIRYKAIDAPLGDVAKELGVKYIFEGSYLPVGDRVRVTAQLINAAEDVHLWAESYDREAADILLVQAEVAEAIAETVGLQIIDHNNSNTTASRRRIHPSAYEANLQGRRYRMQLTEDGLTQAIACFEKAIEIEPDYGEAYAGMAGCYCSYGTYGLELREPHKVIPYGMKIAEKAIHLDHSYVEGRAFLGIMKLKYAWDWPGAQHEFEQALALNPHDSRALMQYSLYFESLGNFDQSIEYANRAYDIDPFNKGVLLNRAWQHHQAQDYHHAKVRMSELVDSDPNFWGGHWGLGHVLRELGRLDEAEVAFDKAVSLPGGNTLPLESLGHCRALAGDEAGALAIIAELENLAQTAYVPPYRIAVVAAGLQDEQRMFAELVRSLEVRTRSLAWLAVAKEFAPYYQVDAFQQIIQQIGIPVSANTGE